MRVHKCFITFVEKEYRGVDLKNRDMENVEINKGIKKRIIENISGGMITTELAIIFPIITLLIIGVIYVSIYCYDKTMINNMGNACMYLSADEYDMMDRNSTNNVKNKIIDKTIGANIVSYTRRNNELKINYNYDKNIWSNEYSSSKKVKLRTFDYQKYLLKVKVILDTINEAVDK